MIITKKTFLVLSIIAATSLTVIVSRNIMYGPPFEPSLHEVHTRKVIYNDGYEQAYTSSSTRDNGCISTTKGEVCGTYHIYSNPDYIPKITDNYYQNLRKWEKENGMTAKEYWEN